MDASYANTTFWSSIGTTIGFGYSNALCNYVKIYITLCGGTFALICYYLAEWLVAKEQKYHMDKSDEFGCENHGLEVMEYKNRCDNGEKY